MALKQQKMPSSQRETFADYFKKLATPQENPNFKDELLKLLVAEIGAI